MKKIGRCFYVLEGAGWLQCFPASLALFKRSEQAALSFDHQYNNFYTMLVGMMAQEAVFRH